jgi:predicted benzoate:H+ symporter BenE
MTSAVRTSLPPKFWEILAALALILWRVGSYPVATLWRDWVVLLGVFWIFTALRHRSPEWPIFSAVWMAALLVLYAGAQVPPALAALDCGP